MTLLLIFVLNAWSAVPCKFDRHKDGSDRIYAQNSLDLHFCWGVIQAKDRKEQLADFIRILKGEKAKITGFSSIREDLFFRLLRLGERGALLFQSMKETEWGRELTRFSEGVESVAPELHWKPEYSISILLLQSFDQTRKGITQALQNSKLELTLGEKRFQRLFQEEGLPWFTPVIESVGEVSSSVASTQLEEDGQGHSFGGSNNWVIAKGFKNTKHAWFANDPHLSLRSPPFWHPIHVETPGLRAFGFAVPGVPLIASGVNEKLAWGLTNSYLPAIEINEVERDHLKGIQSERPFLWFQTLGIQIPFFFKKIEWTEAGDPLLPLGDVPSGKAWVLRWSGFSLTEMGFSALSRIWRAKNAEEMDSLLSQVELPSWNFVYTDVKGKIGYRAVGKIIQNAPKKIKKVERISPLHFYDSSELPALRDPRSGVVITANQRQLGGKRGEPLVSSQSLSFRAFRIRELLHELTTIDFPSLKRVQCDVQSVDARFLLSGLLSELKGLDPEEEKLKSELSQWDFESNLESKMSAPFRRWIEKLKEMTGFNEVALFRLMQEKDPEMLLKISTAFQAMVKELSPLHGVKWGELHQAPFFSLMGASKITPWKTPGDEHTVNNGNASWDPKLLRWNHSNGPSERIIVELSNPPKVWWSLAGGEIADWVGCKYHSFHF